MDSQCAWQLIEPTPTGRSQAESNTKKKSGFQESADTVDFGVTFSLFLLEKKLI